MNVSDETKSTSSSTSTDASSSTFSNCDSVFRVDLKLDSRLKPTDMDDYRNSGRRPTSPVVLAEKLVPEMVYAIGSPTSIPSVGMNDNTNNNHDEVFFRMGDKGLFGAAMEAWKNHWVLRTGPEDWWHCVAGTIAKAIDKAAQQEEHDFSLYLQHKDRSQTPSASSSGSDSETESVSENDPNRSTEKDEEKSIRFDETDDGGDDNDEIEDQKLRHIRRLFVSHNGKQNIEVIVPVETIYEVEYNHVMSTFASEIESKVKVPDFVNAMQNNFTTSTSTHTIASQVNLMASLQQFFSYEMGLDGCGLKGLEMKGTVEDWEMLQKKLIKVREILRPIEKYLWDDISDDWWDGVDDVFRHLAMSRATPDDPHVADFWKNILLNTVKDTYVSNGYFGGRTVKVKSYDGWLVRFLLGHDQIEVSDLMSGHYDKELSGINTVPLKVTLSYLEPSHSEETRLMAGMVGYMIHDNGNNENGNSCDEHVPSVEPYHMWSMMVDPSSQLLEVSTSYQSKFRKPGSCWYAADKKEVEKYYSINYHWEGEIPNQFTNENDYGDY
mmetsp:Transcript_49481/g.120111  ORF Transcript_49481/g.120111 Transcript_49481/m.120111 type:complete len:551 (+) Transcript_49481:874-2526(+)